MKPNPPRAVLERLAFVMWMALACGSLGMALVSPWFPWPRPGFTILLGGSGGCVLAWLFGRFGREHLHFAECEKSLDLSGGAGVLQEDSEPANHLRRVLDCWAELDERREHGDSDPWRVQELRHEAASLLRADPRLRQEFALELSRHPELGER